MGNGNAIKMSGKTNQEKKKTLEPGCNSLDACFVHVTCIMLLHEREGRTVSDI